VSDSPANDATRRSDERTASKFTNRLAAALSIGIVFVALSAADAYGFAGMQAGWWLLPVAIGLAVAATDELIRLYTKRGLLLPGRLLRPGVALVVLSGILRPQQADAWAALAAPAIVHVAFLLLIMAVAVIDYRPERLALERLAGAFFVATYIGMLITFLVALRFVVQPDGGRPDMLPLVSLVAVVKGGDICAYVVGVLFGKSKMAPVLSPGKTWEGTIASLAGATAISWLLLEQFSTENAATPLGSWLVYGPLVGLAGIVGDLGESLVKRELQAKDSGGVLGGLGGVLDMIDSMLVAAPVAWLLWAFG
jgi:phosphatidate cytidylyltransferase